MADLSRPPGRTSGTRCCTPSDACVRSDPMSIEASLLPSTRKNHSSDLRLVTPGTGGAWDPGALLRRRFPGFLDTSRTPEANRGVFSSPGPGPVPASATRRTGTQCSPGLIGSLMAAEQDTLRATATSSQNKLWTPR
ncbi:hypothetical protein HPB50_028937 [Hyalomma asiaticum]|nr:hypothetical protein HPB50_028937 [Hyalomma asiaticum]